MKFIEKLDRLTEKLEYLQSSRASDDPELIATQRLIELAYSIEDFESYLSWFDPDVTALDELNELQAAYEHPIIISHNGHTLKVPFSAELYQSLVDLVNIAKEEF